MENKNNNNESIESDSTVDRPLPNITLETLTESLGFESFNENSKCSFDEAVEAAEPRSRSNTVEAKEETDDAQLTDFPPILSSLNENGRPRFNLEKVRENGRLQISCVENTRPEVIVERTPPGEDDEGSVRIRFIDEETNNNSSSSSSSSGKEE